MTPADAAALRPVFAQAPVTAPGWVAMFAGFALGSLLVALVAAAVYRWYVREAVPRGLTTMLGVGSVAVVLNTGALFGQLIGGIPGTADPFATRTVVQNVLSLAVAAAAAPVGRRIGDRLFVNVAAVAGAERVEGDVSRYVRTLGRVRAVRLPDEIDDMEGHDPVDDATKERLAGTTLVFPRRLSDPEFRDRFVTRLKEEYGVSHVDVEFEDGDVSYLAVGMRVAGIGPTLGPGTCAVAVRADPPNGVSPGDVVQVWAAPEPAEPAEQTESASQQPTTSNSPVGPAEAEPEAASTPESPTEHEPESTPEHEPEASPEATRVATAEVRASAGDVVTLAVDEADAPALNADREFRLLTLPAEPRADREFASLLRAADETMAVVTLQSGSALAGAAVSEVPGAVIAVKPADGTVEAIPPRKRMLGAGETLYVVARPESLREVERLAGAGNTDGGTESPESGQ
ncbi:potassium transporter TrkA [Halobaculum sp. D14]|uniref:potassium transporter TrkA n=1 Tax=Halobaculum sp. D14 TaxID=3421642 RepID=UPI003EBCE4F0